jgi:aldehyde:ferredoxin oxidoreductase
MTAGCFGRILCVDLSQGRITHEAVPAPLYRQVLGGQGLGVRLLHERIPRGADPLGPENGLGFFPGLLTGSGVAFSGRMSVVGKSPLTGAWGESNCGGQAGPVLRAAGLDGVLVTGASSQPVYLWIEDGAAELRDATSLWGLGTVETEHRLEEAVGPRAQVLSIGPAGEMRSLLAGIATDGGRMAARTGLGAVMGAKRLKAVAVRGSRRLPLHDGDELRRLNADYLRLFKRKTGPLPWLIERHTRLFLPVMRQLRVSVSVGPAELVAGVYGDYGTCFGTAFSTEIGDAPVQNWRGVGGRDIPLAQSAGLGGEAVVQHQLRRYHCRHCPVGCGGIVRLEGERYQVARSHKPEYETLAAFGPLLLNGDLEAIFAINDLCNRYGLDTISVGTAVAFALECAEHGLIGPAEADGLALEWGDSEAIVALVQRIARREGIGDLLADGVRRAAERIGGGAEAWAMHAGGQELPMHDSRYEPLMGLVYQADATPGRHTPANGGMYDVAALREIYAAQKLSLPGRYRYKGKGALLALLNRYLQVVDAAGLCFFSLLMGRPPVREWINAATGWELSLGALLEIGYRVQVLRQAFSVREGVGPGDVSLPARAQGEPPLTEGPLRDVTLDMDTMVADYYRAMGYDAETGLPPAAVLDALGLPDRTSEPKGT